MMAECNNCVGPHCQLSSGCVYKHNITDVAGGPYRYCHGNPKMISLKQKIERLTAERDEAREWARKYKRELDNCVDVYDTNSKILHSHYADAHNERIRANRAEHELRELQRKYKQATCEHEGVKDMPTGDRVKCQNCGRIFKFIDWITFSEDAQ